MADIANFLAQEILTKLISIAADQLSLAWGFKSELKSLQKRVDKLLKFLAGAEDKPSSFVDRDDVQDWLQEIKEAVYDADAVFDEFRYEQLRQKIEVQGRCKSKVTDFFSPSKNPFAFRLKLAHKIRNINMMLDRINKQATDGLALQAVAYALRDREINEAPCRSWRGDLEKVVGRESDVSAIVDNLINLRNEKRLSVICIVGMAGQGKTTLAHLVSENNEVVRHFDKTIIWVSVSNDFKVIRILNHMVEDVTKQTSLLSESAVVGKLSGLLKDKKFLLILDDVWNRDADKWKSLEDALLSIRASIGSRVIVTTRDADVALVMQPYFTHPLGKLSSNYSWAMFRQIAFVEGGAPESQALVDIGRRIVERCGGVPLAIEVLGRLLFSKKSEGEWKLIEESKVWGSIEPVDNLAIKVLKLSYDHLSPPYLKHCFSYLSIFPKDSDIRQDSVVQMWVALGLFPKGNNPELEDAGNKYFDALFGKSLLQDPKIDDDDVKLCKMHDLVHDLAQQTSRGYCLALANGDEVSDASDDVIYLSLSSSIEGNEDSDVSDDVSAVGEDVMRSSLSSPFRETLEKLKKGSFKRLQTLILEDCVLDNFENLKLLRVLVLVGHVIVVLPESVGKLRNLRYLDISRTNINKFPVSFTRLYNLQTLKMHYYIGLPERLGNLINLRHFYGGKILTGVGKLTSLRTLRSFTVSRQLGCLIGELGGLNKLEGLLHIRGLEEVENLHEAQSAKLSQKLNIKTLEFNWEWHRQDGVPCSDEDVLEGLRPHSNLRSLEIFRFMGLKLASWMMSESVFALNNLVNIRLSYCERCEQVPALGHLPNLKVVDIFGLENVRRIGAEFYGNREGVRTFFPVLTELSLGMSNLEEWVDVKDEFSSSSSSSSFTKKQQPYQFPNLQKFLIQGSRKLIALPISIFEDCVDIKELTIRYCRNIKVIPDIKGLQTLTHLELIGLGKSITELPRGIQTLTSLKTLQISDFPGVVSVPDLGGLTRLETLSMWGFPSLVSVPYLGGLTRLETLEIGGFSEKLDEFPWPYDYSSSSSSSLFVRKLILRGWAKLQHLPQQLEHLSASLTELELITFDGLESLPEWLGNLSSLQYLLIWSAKNLKSIPSEETMHRLTKLQRLEIRDSSVLEEKCVKGSGTEWHKIQHIPRIEIYRRTIQDNRV